MKNFEAQTAKYLADELQSLVDRIEKFGTTDFKEGNFYALFTLAEKLYFDSHPTNIKIIINELKKISDTI